LRQPSDFTRLPGVWGWRHGALDRVVFHEGVEVLRGNLPVLLAQPDDERHTWMVSCVAAALSRAAEAGEPALIGKA
jgi:hypothetical protein